MPTVLPVAMDILVVDDDPELGEIVACGLTIAGYRAVSVAGGADALRLLRRSRALLPRMIVLDVLMPGMDGWAFRAEQRKDRALANIPVILLTPAAGDTPLGIDPGAVGYLAKPFGLGALLAAVHRTLGAAPLTGT